MAGTQLESRRRRRSRKQIMSALERAFREVFPHDTVDISDGYMDNIHVMVVSRKFDRLSERKKRDLLWDVIDRAGLSESEKDLISLVYPISPAEIK